MTPLNVTWTPFEWKARSDGYTIDTGFGQIELRPIPPEVTDSCNKWVLYCGDMVVDIREFASVAEAKAAALRAARALAEELHERLKVTT